MSAAATSLRLGYPGLASLVMGHTNSSTRAPDDYFCNRFSGLEVRFLVSMTAARV